MKRLFFLIILLLSTKNIISAQLKSEVNECFELTSIVFRLAGAPEYSNTDITTYANEIDSYFRYYKNHPLIYFAQEIREKNGIAYDAVAKAAACLEIKKGMVKIKPDVDISKVSEIEKRWSEDIFRTFVIHLNDFYRKTNFRKFYSQHTELYNIATKRMDELLKDLNIEWYESIFGEGVENAVIIVSLCNGASNYAFSIKAKEKIQGIVIGCGADREGLPWQGKNKIEIIVHELLHFYTNDKIREYWDILEEPSRKIYSYVKDDMFKLAYGSANTVINEWFTHLLTILYLQQNPIISLPADLLLKVRQEQGLIWTERAIRFMEHFQNNRDKFKTIDDYMPQIVGFINYTANNFEHIIEEYNHRKPYIVEIYPAPGTTISSDIRTIKIRFSEPMSADIHGVLDINDENILHFLISEKPSWLDEYTYVVKINPDRLEKGKTYGFKLKNNLFESKKTYTMQQDYIYTFNTNEK